jgi:hypothetical protein
MTEKKHYGDPRKQAAEESSKKRRGTSQRELSVGFVFFAWIVFFLLWLVAGLLAAAIVCGLMLSGAIALLNR